MGSTPADSSSAPDPGADSRSAATDDVTVVQHPRFPRIRRWRLLVGVAATLAVLLIAALVMVVVVRDTQAERVVRGYLDAAREGRIADALEFAGAAPLKGESARFLDRDAVNGAWEIRELEETYSSSDFGAGGGRAEVEVVIDGPGGTTAETTFVVLDEDGAVSIEDPFITKHFYPSPLWYLDLNGMTAPAAEDMADQEYLLLPGYYRLHEDPPEGLRVDGGRALLLPRMPPDPDPMAPVPLSDVAVSLTSGGAKSVEETLNAYIDGCAETTELDPLGCPFGADYYVGPDIPELDGVTDHRDVEWKVLEYPDATVDPSDSTVTFRDREEGRIKLSATGTESDGSTIDYTAECAIDTRQLEAGFTAKRAPRVVPQGTRHLDPDDVTHEDAYSQDTCR